MAIDPLSPIPATLSVPPAEPIVPTGAPDLPAGKVTALTLPLSGPSKGKAKRQRVPVATTSTGSSKYREAVLRGKEGTRRRQRWENDRLLSNPHVVPPSAADWQPSLHPKRYVPYEIASLWDSPGFEERRQRNQPKRQETRYKTPKDLKARLKRSHGAIGLLRALEEETRKFLLSSLEQEQLELERPESPVHVNIEDVEDESDEEIVFVSKKMRYQLKREESMKSFIEVLATEKVLFESLLSDPNASFGRWLVHSIAAYYGLRSWSITTGNPEKRLAYVGLRTNISAFRDMPMPLYMTV